MESWRDATAALWQHTQEASESRTRCRGRRWLYDGVISKETRLFWAPYELGRGMLEVACADGGEAHGSLRWWRQAGGSRVAWLQGQDPTHKTERERWDFKHPEPCQTHPVPTPMNLNFEWRITAWRLSLLMVELWILVAALKASFEGDIVAIWMPLTVSTMFSALAMAAFVCQPVLVLCHMILVYVFLYDLCPSSYRILVCTLGIRCLYPRVFF